MKIGAIVIWAGDLSDNFPTDHDQWFNWILPAGEETVQRISVVRDVNSGLNIINRLLKAGVETNVFFDPSPQPSSGQELKPANNILLDELLSAPMNGISENLNLVSLVSFSEFIEDLQNPDHQLVTWWQSTFGSENVEDHATFFDSPGNLEEAYWLEFERWLLQLNPIDQAQWQFGRKLRASEFVPKKNITKSLAVHRYCPAIRFELTDSKEVDGILKLPSLHYLRDLVNQGEGGPEVPAGTPESQYPALPDQNDWRTWHQDSALWQSWGDKRITRSDSGLSARDYTIRGFWDIAMARKNKGEVMLESSAAPAAPESFPARCIETVAGSWILHITRTSIAPKIALQEWDAIDVLLLIDSKRVDVTTTRDGKSTIAIEFLYSGTLAGSVFKGWLEDIEDRVTMVVHITTPL